MARPVWFVNFLKKIYPSRHALARLTQLPGVGCVVDHLLFRDDEIFHLPQDHTVEINANIKNPGSTILPSRVLEHFIRQADHHWVMDACICREGDGCQDYPHNVGCIFLGKSATKINPSLGKRVTERQAMDHARRAQEAGLVHSIGRSRLDAVWLGAFPSRNLLTICHCCPCCCLWGLAPHLDPRIGNKIGKMPGVSVTVNGSCTGCGLCTDGICVMGALEMVNGRARVTEECRGCGRCVELCPDNAIELDFPGSASIHSTVARLSPLVDLP